MTRAERRRQEKESRKSEKAIMIKGRDIQKIKDEATDDAFKAALIVPVMVLHDKYGQLMKKELDGRSREERFFEYLNDLWDTVIKGYVSLEELADCLEEECGLQIVKKE